jgi:hypothetical protein
VGYNKFKVILIGPEMDELEQTLREIIARKNAAEIDSPQYRFANRQLRGLRYTREGAGGIIEDLDPLWGDTAEPL